MVRTSAVLLGFLVVMTEPLVHAQGVLSTIGITTVPLLIRDPNTSIPGGPAPFTAAARWSYYLRRTYQPQRLAILGLETAVDHALRQPTCWDRSPASYLTRYSRAFDRRLIRNTAEFGAGLLTGEDLRYRRQGSGNFYGRVRHAVRGAFMAQMRGGAARPAYSRFGASIIAELGTAHWAGQHITSGWLAQAVAEGALDQVETNLLDEFTPDLRRIGKTLRGRLAARSRGKR